jgi:hypothetical protein
MQQQGELREMLYWLFDETLAAIRRRETPKDKVAASIIQKVALRYEVD